jgi:hypothetical protein
MSFSSASGKKSEIPLIPLAVFVISWKKILSSARRRFSLLISIIEKIVKSSPSTFIGVDQTLRSNAMFVHF